MNFGVSSVIILLILLPGFHFFSGVQSLTYQYISQSFVSWKAPTIIGAIFTATICIHCCLISFLCFTVWLNPWADLQKILSINFDNELFKLKNIYFLTSFLIFYTLSSSTIGRLSGRLISNYCLIKDFSLLQAAKHDWVLSLIKSQQYSKNDKSQAFVYTTEEDEDECRIVYTGDLSDFFVGDNGEIEYIALSKAKRSDAVTIEWAIEENLKPNEIWVPVGNSNGDDYLYISGEYVFNILVETKYNSDDKIDWIEHLKFRWYFIAIFVFIFLLFQYFTSELDINDSDVNRQQISCPEEKPKDSTCNDYLINNYYSSDLPATKKIKSVYLTNTNNINVRSSPSKNSRIKLTIEDINTPVFIIERVAEDLNWYRVELPNGNLGYIYSDLLEPLNSSTVK